MASGVGTAKILGKIHMVQMKLGSSYFPVSITVLENSSLDMLFGLDTLRRYRCSIDLAKNVLRMMDGSNGVEEVPFLGEGEIPQKKENIDEGQGFLGGGEPKEAAAGEKEESDMKVDDAAVTSSAAHSSPIPSREGDEASLKSLVDMGFPEPEARQALEACGGNAEEAANLLFASR